MSDDITQDGAEPSPASAGSRVVAWAVVSPSGGTRFLGLTSEDAQREATNSEQVVPVHWPTLTDAEREAIAGAMWDYGQYADELGLSVAEVTERQATLRGLLDRTE
jgi:hypothetical protein